MPHPVKTFGAVALGALIGLATTAEAQTIHRHHVARPAADGRQITVYGAELYLTAGTAAPVGAFSAYALDTVTPGIAPFRPGIDNTTAGQWGMERLPNTFTVPGCCEP